MSSQVERGTVREMVHTIAFRAGMLERILREPVLGSLEIRTDELAHVQLLQRGIDDLRRYLNLPSAEPERNKGEWIEYPECLAYEGAYTDTDIVCSACHHVFNIIDNCTEEFDFCPHCGAEMTR